eukprot:CAMPEP_0119020510 /NCGR_PEP_ID=MMETSP1176-20130426/24201_1 /TAXON_ID=265551 /ORGANISM="Synedropsis recta cf, Strain CCMP1620" /LENGTH=468 /DNA_ID=CAMNT_0006974947 /DNA_START=119 /DNA_END=1522 /DNA_ORIENTATION=-
MSSGTLPLSTYHRAQSLGAGTYGSVVAVYNDDGEEFALKLFIEDDDEEEDDNEDATSCGGGPTGMDVGALREISVLRLLRGANAHKNIVEMADIKEPSCGGDDDEDFGEEGAGVDGLCLAMAMPLYQQGNLADAIDDGTMLSRKRDKVAIAHGLLSAVAHLHDNGLMHRDIKSDNVMLINTDGQEWSPVLIDFSLAKVAVGSMYNSDHVVLQETATHTGEVGTVTYTAPEVVDSKPYGLKTDLWSVGVILLEMIQNHTIEADKNKEAFRIIETALGELPDQPLPNLIRGLLTVNPDDRLSARQALESPLFVKFGFNVPPVTIVDIDAALPLEVRNDDEEAAGESSPEGENIHPNVMATVTPAKKKIHRKKQTTLRQRRDKLVRQLCSELDLKHPLTPVAALCYAQQLYQELDDTVDNLKESQGLLDCVVLASRIFEVDLLDLNELPTAFESFQAWDRDEYLDSEATLW